MEEHLSFEEVLEAAESLPVEEQESHLGILRNRLRERRREELGQDIREAEREFAEGKLRAATPEEIMKEILS